MSGKFNRKAITIIVAVVAVIAVVGSSFAWFVTNSSLSQKFTISNIEASASVYFLSEGKKADASRFKDKDGLYTLSLNENDENYIGNMRITVNRTGSKSCMRVKLVYEWKNADTLIQYTTDLPYEFNSEWYDNRNEDYCVYYMGSDFKGKANFDSQELIMGFDNSEFKTAGFTDDTTVRVMVEVDAVQVNRYPQMWNIDNLPWQ